MAAGVTEEAPENASNGHAAVQEAVGEATGTDAERRGWTPASVAIRQNYLAGVEDFSAANCTSTQTRHTF